ncbi:MAG TPA: nuclear transport factor 2 family protein [Chryseolinea sp.]
METLETMKTTDIARRLVDYCRKGDWNGAQDELYSKDAVSIEQMATPAFEKETKGLEAIKAKGEKFDSMVEKVYKITVSEPLVAGNSFAFVLGLDVKMKGQERLDSPEICVYEVKDGKIISEQFFL